MTEIDDCYLKNNIYGNTDSRAAKIRGIGNRKNDLPNTVPFLLLYPFFSSPFSNLLYSSLLYSILLYSSLLFSSLLFPSLLFSPFPSLPALCLSQLFRSALWQHSLQRFDEYLIYPRKKSKEIKKWQKKINLNNKEIIRRNKKRNDQFYIKQNLWKLTLFVWLSKRSKIVSL